MQYQPVLNHPEKSQRFITQLLALLHSHEHTNGYFLDIQTDYYWHVWSWLCLLAFYVFMTFDWGEKWNHQSPARMKPCSNHMQCRRFLPAKLRRLLSNVILSNLVRQTTRIKPNLCWKVGRLIRLREGESEGGAHRQAFSEAISDGTHTAYFSAD